MFHINDHSKLGLFVFYGKDLNDAYIASVSCCDLEVHSFENQTFIGFNVCECCGQVEALFVLRDSAREDGAGSIYATVRIEDVREFAGCTTVDECRGVLSNQSNSAPRAA